MSEVATDPGIFDAQSSKRRARAQLSIAATFLAHALLFASWTAHIPQVKSQLALSDGDLGTALLGAPIGSVTAMVLSTRLLPRLGSRRMIRITVVGYAMGGVGVGLAGTAVQLFAALVCWGLFQGALDVAMNTQAVTIERAVRQPIMARLHGMWSIGGFLGAVVGAGAVAVGIDPGLQLMAMGVLSIAIVEVLSRALIPDGAGTAETGSRRRGRGSGLSAVVVTLGGIAFASMLCEGAAADWSATYLRDELGTDAGPAGLGYATYALAMVAMRLSGTLLGRRFRTDRLLPILAIVFALGMGSALLTRNLLAALIGFACMGIGLALIVPSAFSAAGAADHGPSRSNSGSIVATVAALGWCGFVSGPPLIGHLADLTGLTVALWILPLLALVIATTTRFGKAFAVASGDPIRTGRPRDAPWPPR
ncbi:MFS transporter [Nocardia sp. BMG51109]|uniref:MFS transporter n=1 Tax=Nocardia sp. BMG51109 TaxID=1056816 RepID=UPI0004657E81|nr:MFS transporter [Nocardia sp. BMG51109]